MHQAFYHHHTQMINQWDDKEYRKKFTVITKSDKRLWDNIDSVKFMHKDDPEIGTPAPGGSPFLRSPRQAGEGGQGEGAGV